MENIGNSERKRKSERLTSEERRQFERLVKKFPTKLDATEFLGFGSRNTLDNILRAGSGHPTSIALIREKLNAA